MTYPYDLHLAPSLGRGLPGLPVRGEADTEASTTKLFPQYASSDNRRLLAPCPAKTRIGNASYSFDDRLFSVHPLAGSRDTAIMARYYYNSGWDYEYVGFRYTREALTFGSPVETITGDDSLPPQAIALPDGRWVYSRDHNRVYQVTLEAATLAVSQAQLFYTPTSGVLVTGEPYTRVTTTSETPIQPDANSTPNLLLSPQHSLVLFHGLMVDGLYWIGCFEYDLSGQLLAVRKLFIPPLHHASTAPYRRQLEVRHIGRWYHCVFADTGPSANYRTKLSYFSVRDDFTAMPKVREAGYFDPASTQAWVKLFADAGSVMFFIGVSDTVPYGQAWLLALDAHGAPSLAADNSVGQLGGADFVGDTSLANNILRRVYAPQSGLHLKTASNSMPTISVPASRRAMPACFARTRAWPVRRRTRWTTLVWSIATARWASREKR